MADGWFTEVEKADHSTAYEAELISRFQRGLPLTKAAAKEARALILARAVTARQTALAMG